jgi:hypothetical protein
MRLKFIFIFSFILFVSCQKQTKEQKKEVTLIKQWHLAAHQNTLDIDKSKKLPQFRHQQDIYQRLKLFTSRHQNSVVISEGCEGVIDKDFKPAHYGWTYQKLKDQLKKPQWSNIMALMPLKLKVEHENTLVTCGDSDELISQNSLAFSDLRGYVGYFKRLVETKENKPRLYKSYANSLMKELKMKKGDPLRLAQKSALSALKRVELFIEQRNNVFVQSVVSHPKSKAIIVIGGLHISDLKMKLNKEGYQVNVVTPLGYVDQDTQLLKTLEKLLTTQIYQ